MAEEQTDMFDLDDAQEQADVSRRNFLALMFCLMLGTAGLPHLLDGRREALETFAYLRQHGLALRRDFQGAGQPVKEADTEIALQQLDLLADGSWRHMQFLGGFLEAEMAGGGFESPHAGERR